MKDTFQRMPLHKGPLPPAQRPATKPAFLAENVTQCRYFFFDPYTFSGSKLALPCGGWERCTANYRVHRKSFQYFALEYVVEGRGTFTCNGQTTELQPGILFGYAPGSEHIISTSAEQPMTKYFVDFFGPRAKSIFRRLPLSEGCTNWIRQPHVIHDLFQQIVDAGQDYESLSLPLCLSLFEVLVLRIAQNAIRTEEAKCRAFETYSKASHELSMNFRNLQSVSDLAEKMQVTPAYLARLFSRYSNTSPHRALMAVKMAEAASLLVATGMSVIQIAASLGFSDPYHFSRVFKSVYGSSPAIFRKHPRSIS
jgi:AraC-like DNA-binding protein